MPFPRSNSFRGTTSPSDSPQKDAFPSSPGVSRQESVTGRKHKQNAENMPPNTPTGRGSNSVCPDSPVYCKSSTKTNKGNGSVTPLHASPGLPPRPPSASKVPKRKLQWEAQQAADTVPLAADVQSSEGASDTGVTVLVRVRPFNKKEVQEQSTALVSKASSNSLTICEQQYTFDAVAGEDSSQDDMFQIVGLPMVDNCLAGFNSSIFAYGQTGSGKTYTMWGVNHDPTSGKSPSKERGLTPRVFETLFAKIKEEEKKNADKQLYYQCRCSFLEIYNEQIADLLEPRHKNLQIREDVKTGVYVDNLTEEYVSNMDDVARLLLKGLGNRRIGATSMNAESSRSHTVFTCVLECRFKSVADGMSSVRRSRINLVDLAGSERQKQSGAAGERLKEAGNINRSLSQLGNVINILAEIAQTGKQRHVPYRDSRLTFLLQESLGGNAKLAMICAVSPADSCKNETTSTLRFAQRAKAIQNKAVINEETTTDSNILREQIRQLKDELKRMKSKESQQVGGDGAYSSGWNARRSYNLLRLSLALPMTVPATEESDTDEEMEIDEDAVEDSGHATAMLAPTSPTMTELAPASPPMTESSTTIVPFSLNSRKSLEVRSSLRSSKLSTMVTERIAASLQRGLQILDDHQQNSSDLRFSFKTQCEPQEEHSPEKMPTAEAPQLCLPQSDDMHSQEIEELKEALELAMTGHARLLEQYAELQEKHVALVAKHRRIREGVTDVRQMASKAGVGPSQLKWLESQAAQIVALNLEREQERQAANEEIEFLQAQLQDTAEAVQAAGELLVRLKEAEESVTIANDAAAIAEQEADRLYREMEKLKRRHATEMATLQQRLLESRLRRSAACPMCVMAERVKFQFTEVDPENAAAALEADQDAAALTEEQQQDEPTNNMVWDGAACEDEFAEASSMEAEDFEDGAQEIQDLYDGSDDRCNF